MLPQTPFEQKVNLESSKATYICIIADYTPYTTATDMLVLQNPATSTKVLKITRVTVNGDATAAAIQDVYCVMQNTLNTGGTSTTPVTRAHDAMDPACSAVPLTYSAAPTLGTGRTVVRAGHYVFPAATTPAFGTPDGVWQWGDHAAKCPTVYPGMQFGLSCAQQAISAGLSLYLTIEWTEE